MATRRRSTQKTYTKKLLFATSFNLFAKQLHIHFSTIKIIFSSKLEFFLADVFPSSKKSCEVPLLAINPRKESRIHVENAIRTRLLLSVKYSFVQHIHLRIYSVHISISIICPWEHRGTHSQTARSHAWPTRTCPPAIGRREGDCLPIFRAIFQKKWRQIYFCPVLDKQFLF
jgi:hypothetical protein